MPMYYKFILSILLVISTSISASAKEVIGISTVNDRSIEIFDDNTWSFKSSKRKNLDECETLKASVLFCNINQWKALPATGSANHLYQIDDRSYAMFIIETIGSNDGMTQSLAKDMALQYAAEASNTNIENITQHFSTNKVVNDYDYLSFAYSTKIQGINFTYINNIYIDEMLSVQAFTFSLGEIVTTKQTKLNYTLIDNIIMP